MKRFNFTNVFSINASGGIIAFSGLCIKLWKTVDNSVETVEKPDSIGKKEVFICLHK